MIYNFAMGLALGFGLTFFLGIILLVIQEEKDRNHKRALEEINDNVKKILEVKNV